MVALECEQGLSSLTQIQNLDDLVKAAGKELMLVPWVVVHRIDCHGVELLEANCLLALTHVKEAHCAIVPRGRKAVVAVRVPTHRLNHRGGLREVPKSRDRGQALVGNTGERDSGILGASEHVKATLRANCIQAEDPSCVDL